MGNQVVILLFGTLALFAIYMIGFRERGNELTRNTSESFAEASAHEVNRSAMDIAMSELADSSGWRAPYTNLSLFNGTTTVTFQDTVIGSDSCIIVRSSTRYVAGMDTGHASTKAIVTPIKSYVPLVVRGAMTAFGPIDDLIGDMFIDGREHDLLQNIIPGKGRFGISTGQATFSNDEGALIGGTYYVGKIGNDLPTTNPEDPRIIELNSQWPNGWPTTPDKALGLPEGSLRSIALSGVGGSRIFTVADTTGWATCTTGDVWSGLGWPLSPDLHGVSYFDMPNGAYFEKIAIGDSSDGVIVFHSPATDAFWRWIAMDGNSFTDGFEGLFIFDRIFHIHLNVLGALVQLNPMGHVESCGGNNNHWIRYSAQAIKESMEAPAAYARGSWKNKLRVISWYE